MAVDRQRAGDKEVDRQIAEQGQREQQRRHRHVLRTFAQHGDLRK
jgi:hypothetical protein